MQALEIAIQLSDLYEAVGAEGGLVPTLIDKEIIPYLAEFKASAEFKGGIGLGDRFNGVIDKVRASANRTGKDSVRTLRDMLKSALVTYVQKTHDALSARTMFHRAVMSGSDTMLTATAAVILANALHGSHSKEAQSLVQSITARLSGGQHPASHIPAMENASGSASGAGGIAIGGKKKKPQKDSIFCESGMDTVCVDLPLFIRMLEFAREDAVDDMVLHRVAERAEHLGRRGKKVLDMNDYNFLVQDNQTEQPPAQLQPQPQSNQQLESMSWNDVQDIPNTIDLLAEIAGCGCSKKVSGEMVDPSTAELVMSVHKALPPRGKQAFEKKPLGEMVGIAHRCIQRGLIRVEMTEA